MSYQSARDALIDAAYDWQRREFLSTYDPAARTIILIPGGMGSQLDRTRRAFAPGRDIPFGEFVTVWASFGLIFSGEADALRLNADGEDHQRRILVPNGPVRWKPFFAPYDQAKRHFRDRGFNTFVFGYDWRRPPLENAMHLDGFLRALAREADALRGDSRGLPRTTLLAHSQGGLVAATYLHLFRARRGESLDRYVESFISVGTPFYGTTTHVERYYVGDPLLNWRLGRRRLASSIASMPGPYALCHLDLAAYQSLLATTDFGSELPAYPTLDASTGEPVDTTEPDAFERWPSWMREPAWRATILGYLRDTADWRDLLARPLPPAAAARTYHLRAGRTRSVVGLRWGDWPEGGDEDDAPSPFERVERDGSDARAGDGVVPFWSARLAHTPRARIYDLEQADVHMDFFEHPEVLAAAGCIIDDGNAPTLARVRAAMAGVDVVPSPRASEAVAARFLRDADALSPGDPAASDPATWKRVLESFSIC